MEVTCSNCGATVSFRFDDLVPVKVIFGDLTSLDKICPQIMAREKTGQAIDYLCDTLTMKSGTWSTALLPDGGRRHSTAMPPPGLESGPKRRGPSGARAATARGGRRKLSATIAAEPAAG